MTETSAQSSLHDADRLARKAKRSSRWYALYLVIYAAGTFLASVLIGAIPGPTGLTIAMVMWVALIGGLTIYSSRQKATIKRFGLLHGLVIATWAGLWVITVVFGGMSFGSHLGWWIGGGIACALPPLVGAAIVLARTR